MRTVHKYGCETRANAVVGIRVRRGARFLHGQDQGNRLCVWAEVDDAVGEEETREVCFVGTGYEVPEGFAFLNTFLTAGGGLVFHVYVR